MLCALCWICGVGTSMLSTRVGHRATRELFHCQSHYETPAYALWLAISQHTMTPLQGGTRCVHSLLRLCCVLTIAVFDRTITRFINALGLNEQKRPSEPFGVGPPSLARSTLNTSRCRSPSCTICTYSQQLLLPLRSRLPVLVGRPQLSYLSTRWLMPPHPIVPTLPPTPCN
jgi:hypothetical protein